MLVICLKVVDHWKDACKVMKQRCLIEMKSMSLEYLMKNKIKIFENLLQRKTEVVFVLPILQTHFVSRKLSVKFIQSFCISGPILKSATISCSQLITT